MGASTVFKHLTVDGKQLSWPEAACIRLVDGEYEFVWRQGAVKQVLTLAVVAEPEPAVEGRSAATAQPERAAHVVVANNSVSALADTQPEPAQPGARPCLVTEAMRDQEPAAAAADGPQAVFVDDTQDNASGTQPSEADVAQALQRSISLCPRSLVVPGSRVQAPLPAPTAALSGSPEPISTGTPRAPSASADAPAAAAPSHPFADLAVDKSSPPCPLRSPRGGLADTATAAGLSAPAALQTPNPATAPAATPAEPAASAMPSGPFEANAAAPAEPVEDDVPMLDAGPSVDRPEQISPAAPVPEPAATSKATPAARLAAAQPSNDTSTDYLAPLAQLASTASSPQAKGKTKGRRKSSLRSTGKPAAATPQEPMKPGGPSEATPDAAMLRSRDTIPLTLHRSHPAPTPPSAQAPEALERLDRPVLPDTAAQAPQAALPEPAGGPQMPVSEADDAAGEPSAPERPEVPRAAPEAGRDTATPQQHPASVERSAERTPPAELQPPSLQEPLQSQSPDEHQGKENAVPPRQPQTTPTDARPGKKQKSLLPLTSGPTSKRSKAHRSSSPQQPLAGFSWKKLCNALPAGELPCKRWGHSLLAISDTEAILVGGGGQDGPLADSWVLDFQGQRWLPYRVLNQGARAWHAACVAISAEARGLYVVGGERLIDSATSSGLDEDDDTEVVSEMSVMDLRGRSQEQEPWYNLPLVGAPKNGKGQKAGHLPPDRAGHSITRLPNGHLLVFGGMDNLGGFHNDLWEIDLPKLTWFSLLGIAKGAPPKPRAYHSATLVGDKLVVLGGSGKATWSFKEVYTLSIPGYKWVEHTSQVEGEPPCPRGGHTAMALEDGRHLLVFGGGNIDNGAYHSGLALLDTATWRWSTPSVEGVARPVGRLGHASAMLKDQQGRSHVVMFGGRARQDELCQDTWILQLPAGLQPSS